MNKQGKFLIIVCIIILIIIIITSIVTYFVLKHKNNNPTIDTSQLATLYVSGMYNGEYTPLFVVLASDINNSNSNIQSYNIIENFTTINGRLERKLSYNIYSFFHRSDDCYLEKDTLPFLEYFMQGRKDYELFLQCDKKSKINININDSLSLIEGENYFDFNITQLKGKVYFPTICFEWTSNILGVELLNANKININNKDKCMNEGGVWIDNIYSCNIFCKLGLKSEKLVSNATCNVNGETLNNDICYELDTWDASSLDSIERIFNVKYKTLPILRDYDFIKIKILDKERDINTINSPDIYKFKYYDVNNNDLGIKNIEYTIKKHL